MNFLLSMLFLLVRPPCKIGAQLLTDAFGHEIHRSYFQVDSVTRAIFKFCAKQEDKRLAPNTWLLRWSALPEIPCTRVWCPLSPQDYNTVYSLS